MPSRGKILIAEDEPRINSFLERGLRANRYATLVATNRRDTVRLAGTGRFDLLIFDLDDPDAEPGEVLREVREVAPGLPVVVLTAARDERLEPCAGAQEYVRKPFSFDELLVCVRTWLAAAGDARSGTARRRLGGLAH